MTTQSNVQQHPSTVPSLSKAAQSTTIPPRRPTRCKETSTSSRTLRRQPWTTRMMRGTSPRSPNRGSPITAGSTSSGTDGLHRYYLMTPPSDRSKCFGFRPSPHLNHHPFHCLPPVCLLLPPSAYINIPSGPTTNPPPQPKRHIERAFHHSQCPANFPAPLMKHERASGSSIHHRSPSRALPVSTLISSSIRHHVFKPTRFLPSPPYLSGVSISGRPNHTTSPEDSMSPVTAVSDGRSLASYNSDMGSKRRSGSMLSNVRLQVTTDNEQFHTGGYHRDADSRSH